MVLIAEREIISIICVINVFNRAKYYICDNIELASYIFRRTTNAYARAYCLAIFFSYLSIYSIRFIALAWRAVA